MAVTTYMADAYLAALEEPSPLDALRSVVSHELHERHADRDVVLGQLEALRGELRRAGRTRDEEVVLEVMDFLVGWCSPHVCL
jgi:HrpA-like RNA helicase